MGMPFQTIPRITGLDGKRYPASQLSAGELGVLVEVVHELRHDQQLSVAGIQQYLAERGVVRCIGSIYKYLGVACECCDE
jgi:hypothetical protein